MADHRDPDHRGPDRTRVSARAIPSWLVVAGLTGIVIAAVAFFVTGNGDKSDQVTAPVASTVGAKSAPPSPAKAADKTTDKTTDAKKEAKHEEVPRAYVEIFNNSTVTGLASSTSARVQGAGWKVVGTDNWYGNIPETTIYYPKRLKGQAELLAKQIDVDRVRPAVSPMKFDRLTLILTGEL